MAAAATITGQELLALNSKGYTYKELAHNFKLTRGQVAGRIDRYRKRIDMRLATPVNGHSRSDQELERLVSTNAKLWSDSLKRLSSMKRWVKLAFVTDIHLPYQDDAAYELALNIVSDFKPDVLPAGSDIFDFQALSRFEDDRAIHQRVWDGDIANAIRAHETDAKNWRDAAPNAVRPFVLGNHDIRLVKYSFGKAPNTAGYTVSKFWHDISSHGALYLGDTPYLHLSPGVVLTHGSRTGKNAVAKMLEMFGFQRTVIFGHIHSMRSEERRGVDYDVSGYSVPCLCELQPHYSTDLQQWQQGLLIGHYNPNGRECSFQNVRFFRSGGYLRAFLFDKEYRVKL